MVRSQAILKAQATYTVGAGQIFSSIMDTPRAWITGIWKKDISTLCPALDTSSKQTNKNAHDIYKAIPDFFQNTKNNIFPNVMKVRHVDDTRQRDLLRWVFCVPPARSPPPSSVQPMEPPQSSAGSRPAPGAGTCSQSNTITITCAAQQLNT